MSQRNMVTAGGLGLIWLLNFWVLLILGGQSPNVGTLILAMMVTLGPAAIATFLVFYERYHITFTPRGSTRKAKRREESSEFETRFNLLMEMMDDHERVELKQAMKRQLLDSLTRLRDDGELPTDADDVSRLLDQEQTRR